MSSSHATFTWKEVYDYYIGGWRSTDIGELKYRFDWVGIKLSEEEFNEFIEMLEDFESNEIPEALDFEDLWVVRDEPLGENGDIFDHYFGSREEAVEFAKRTFQNFTRFEKKERHILAGHGCYLFGWADGRGGTIQDLETVVWDSLKGGDC